MWVMRLGLGGRVFMVTAASGGLGFAVAQALVAEGAGVLLVSRDQERLAESVSQLGGSQHAIGLAADITDAHAAEQAAGTAFEAFGRLDGAFISTGGPPPGGVLDVEDDTWRQAFDTVFLSALRLARATLAINRSATLGFVLSPSAKSPLAGMAVSNGLRPGLGMLVKQLADEIGPHGGRTFGLIPGLIDTQKRADATQAADHPAAARKAALASVPLRRLGEPDEFGRVAAFLLSDAASYVTGCVIPVDGGVLRAL